LTTYTTPAAADGKDSGRRELATGRRTMHVFRTWQPDLQGKAESSATATREGLDVRRRQQTAEVTGVARCPRCRAVLVAAVRRGRPGFFCRCLARLPIPA
jgi:hypothetical protein